MRFDYLLEKIAMAPMASDPFRHIWIDDFLSAEDFSEVTEAPEVAVSAASDAALLEALSGVGYEIIAFPGATMNVAAWFEWRHTGRRRARESSCQTEGIVLRLERPTTPIIDELVAFIGSEPFNRAMAGRFGIHFDRCRAESGLQKYLDGYEISPHPDVRRKALTFMANLNPRADADALEHHTHYLRLRPERKHIEKFWRAHPEVDRCWLPWDWCETVLEQRRNNSIVIFAPADDTLHAVLADYDHLPGQRTQLYGNLWWKDARPLKLVSWGQLP